MDIVVLALLSLSLLAHLRKDVHNFIKWLLSPTSLSPSIRRRDLMERHPCEWYQWASIENAPANGFLPSSLCEIAIDGDGGCERGFKFHLTFRCRKETSFTSSLIQKMFHLKFLFVLLPVRRDGI